MKITVRREQICGNIQFTQEVTLDAPVRTVEEALPMVAKMAAEFAAPGEGIIAGDVSSASHFRQRPSHALYKNYLARAQAMGAI